MSILATAKTQAPFVSTQTARVDAAKLFLRTFSGSKVDRSFEELVRGLISLMSGLNGRVSVRMDRVLNGAEHFSLEEVEYLRQVLLQRLESEAGNEIVSSMRISKTELLNRVAVFTEDGYYPLEIKPVEAAIVPERASPQRTSSAELPVKKRVSDSNSKTSARQFPAKPQSVTKQGPQRVFEQHKRTAPPPPKRQVLTPLSTAVLSSASADTSVRASAAKPRQPMVLPSSNNAPSAASTRIVAENALRRRTFLQRWFTTRNIPIKFDERSAAYVLSLSAGISVDIVLDWLAGADIRHVPFDAFLERERIKFTELDGI